MEAELVEEGLVLGDMETESFVVEGLAVNRGDFGEGDGRAALLDMHTRFEEPSELLDTPSLPRG